MYACICHALTEHEIRAAIVGGAHDEDAVGKACGAGTSCGTCYDRIGELLDDTVAAAPVCPLLRQQRPTPMVA